MRLPCLNSIGVFSTGQGKMGPTASCMKDVQPPSRRRYRDPIDLNCTHTILQQRWIVESKGSVKNAENRANKFQVGLTQLIYRMRSPEQFSGQMVSYALALPGNQSFEHRCRRIPSWSCQQLQVHWLFVQDDRSVKLSCPPSCTCQINWKKANLPTNEVEENLWSWLET